MAYNVTHLNGAMESNLATSRFHELLDELADADAEHTDVSVTHESEWSLSIFRDGRAILEHLEEGDIFHRNAVERAELIDLMVAVAEGRIAEARSGPWKPGLPKG